MGPEVRHRRRPNQSLPPCRRQRSLATKCPTVQRPTPQNPTGSSSGVADLSLGRQVLFVTAACREITSETASTFYKDVSGILSKGEPKAPRYVYPHGI